MTPICMRKALQGAVFALLMPLAAVGQVWINTNTVSTGGTSAPAGSVTFPADMFAGDDMDNSIPDRIGALEDAVRRVVCAGGYYNKDYFLLSPSVYAYQAASVGSTSTVNSVLAVPRIYENETGYRLEPAVVRQTNWEEAVYYEGLTNVAIVATNGFDIAVWAEGSTTGTVGNFTARLGQFSRSFAVTNAGGAAWTNWHWVADASGSLREHVNTSMLARAAQTNRGQYVYWPAPYSSATNFVRNETNFWAAGIDLTCSSPWNSAAGRYYAGTLVTPQHLLMAAHYPKGLIPVGTVFRFIDATNGVHDAAVAARVDVGYDIAVVLLASELPAEIVPAQVLGEYAKGYFQAVKNLRDDPGYRILYLDQWEQAWFASSIIDDSDGASWTCDWVGVRGETNSVFGRSAAVAGDSGNPIFLVVGTNTVLYSTFYGPGSGPNIAAHLEIIEAGMAAMGGSVHTNLTRLDLSDWTNYEMPPEPSPPEEE
jgi:hypothetical protein